MGSLIAALALLAQAAPPPDAPALRDAEAAIRRFHKADYAKKTPPAMQALARKLLEEAAATTEGPAVKFAYLTESRDLAAQAGDVAGAFAAVDALAALFQVDALAMKTAALATAAKVPRAPVAEGYATLAEIAAAADDFDAALALAGKAGLPARVKELTKARDEFKPVKAALQALESNPTDAAAAQTVGVYRCMVRDDWARGLPFLARAADLSLAALAHKEQDPPAEPALQVVVGDAWRDAGEKQGPLRPRFQARALFWYERAAAGLSGAPRLKLEVQIEALIKALGAVDLPRKGLAFWVEPGRDPAEPFRDQVSGARGAQQGVKVIDSGGKAILFSGTYVSYDAAPAAAIEKRGSAFFWMKSPAWDGLSYVLKRDDDAGQTDIGLYIANGEMSAWLNYPDHPTGYSMKGALPVNKWILLGVTWDERAVTFYLDGKESGTSPAAADGLPKKRTTRLSLGQAALAEGANPQVGLMGSVRIYDRSLSPQEAAQLHLATRSRYR